MNIAVCDDNMKYSQQTEQYIRDIISDRRSLNIDIFNSGDKLLEACKLKSYDIAFLDIEMPGIKGLDVAKKLREKDNNIIIAFLTNYSEFATKGYEVSAFRYILKEEPESIIRRQMISIINEYNRKQKSLVVMIKGEKSIINIDSITYAEVIKRVIVIHTVTGKSYEFYAPLNELLEKLEGYGYVKTHQSFIVNMSYIESILCNTIELKTGESIPLSRTFKRQVETSYINYVISL